MCKRASASEIPIVCVNLSLKQGINHSTPVLILRSNLPGVRRAGSMAFGRFDVPMTTT